MLMISRCRVVRLLELSKCGMLGERVLGMAV